MADTQEQAPLARLLKKVRLSKVVSFIIVTALFGWFYGWASPWCFPENQRVGFTWGMLHGALMPMALPTLVLDKDVEIFDSNNNGRLYKVGYIVGINLCGLVFFGSIFLKPKKPAPERASPSAAAAENISSKV